MKTSNKQLITPNFDRCNLNISATMAEFLNAPNKNTTLPLLKKRLQKGYDKVIYICFDGMGIFPMRQNLPKQDFLMRHVAETLLAPFPSTTTNATTSLATNRYPLEHGWFGWSVHFEHLNRNINIFLNEDSWTGEKVNVGKSPLAVFPYFFDQAQTDYAINTLFPPYVRADHPERNNTYRSLDEFFEKLSALCHKQGKQFVYAYCNEPDHSMHEYGVTNDVSQRLMRHISDKMRQIAADCRNTLFVLTADHGQIDVADYVYLYKDEKLLDMLKIYPYLEPRAIAFLVKDGQKAQFEEYFRQTYGKDFELFTSQELLEKGYFGKCGDKAKLLGDYIAVGNYTHKQAVFTPDQTKFLGHHTGMTEEMEVPLILIDCDADN